MSEASEHYGGRVGGLMGPPGSGKTIMIAETAVNRPVHFIDVDRKIMSNARLRPLIDKGDVTVWELRETMDEETLKDRLMQTAKGKPVIRQPRGWERFSEYMYKLPTTEEGKRAGTWAIDSWTLLGEHCKSLLMFVAQRNKASWDQWNGYLIMMRDTFSVLRDMSREHGKDIIITVHERSKDVPGERTTGVRETRIATTSGNEGVSKEYLGTKDVKIAASIDGQFGLEIGAHLDEFYALKVEVDERTKKPVWRCRVKPDGVRDLRTSFNVDFDECEPDFGVIWGTKKRGGVNA